MPSRFDAIPEEHWPYLGPAFSGLNEDLAALEAGGGGSGFVLLEYGQPLPDPPEPGRVYLRPAVALPGGDAFAPTVPGNVTAYGVTFTGFTVTWSPSEDVLGVTGYEYRVNGADETPTPFTTVVVTGLASGAEYAFEVRARDGAGNRSAWSPLITVSTPAASSVFGAAPPPGTLVSYTDGPAACGTGFTTDLAAGVDVVGARFFIPDGFRFDFYDTDIDFSVLLKTHTAGANLLASEVAAATPMGTLPQPLRAGWNEFVFTTPVHLNRYADGVNNGLWIIARYKPPSRLYISGLGNPHAAVESPAMPGLSRAAAGFPVSVNDIVGTVANWDVLYPIDVMVAS